MRRARAELEGEHTRHLLLLGEPKYLERQEASLRQQLDSARKMGALAGSLATRQAELRLELSEARPRYGAAVAKVKKVQADFEATLSELHFGGKRVNLMGAINVLPRRVVGRVA